MFNKLTERLDGTFKVLSGNYRLTEINIAAAVKEIRRALVEADVNYKIAKEFTDRVKDKALGQENVLKAVKPGELMVKIVNDELTELMGGQAVGINLSGNPTIIMVVGLQGSGKTTFCGKLATHLKEKRNKKPMLVACDVYRPAAVNQLSVLAEQVGVPVYKEEGNLNALQIAMNALEEAKKQRRDVVIIDTACRLSIDEAMMQEVARIKEVIQPNETLLVVDAMTGQDAVNTAENFHNRVSYDGVVLTKLDGDTRGGAALSIKYTTGKPIKFASVGEKMDALDVFHPDRMAQRILGMGDIVSLVEKAQEQFDEELAKKLETKFKRNTFDFNDFLEQMRQVQKMGDIKSLMAMIPGVGKQLKDVEIDERAFVKISAVVQSMTPAERTNPDLMRNSKRKERVSRGCGQPLADVNRFVANFFQMRDMMHQITKGNMPGAPGKGGGGGLMRRR
jgi:signal recognition particle subunit SRP54